MNKPNYQDREGRPLFAQKSPVKGSNLWFTECFCEACKESRLPAVKCWTGDEFQATFKPIAPPSKGTLSFQKDTNRVRIELEGPMNDLDLILDGLLEKAEAILSGDEDDGLVEQSFEDIIDSAPESPEPPPADPRIAQVKQFRRSLDAILQEMKMMGRSSERALAITKIQEGIMWLGMSLKELGAPNPYPSSYDPSSPVVEPTADGLKL